MTLPDQPPRTPAGAYWHSLVENKTPTAKPGDPNFTGILKPRTKALLLGVVATALFTCWIATSTNSHTTSTTTAPGFYSVTQNDALFLSQLSQTGVPYGNAQTAINIGHDIGQLYDQGNTTESLVHQYQLANAQQANPVYTPEQMRKLVYAGIRYYATR